MSSFISSVNDAQSAPAQQKSRPDSPSSPALLQNVTSCYTPIGDSPSARCADPSSPHLPIPQSPHPPPTRRDLSSLKSQLIPLTTSQQNAIELLVMGKTDASVARDLNITRATVNRWRLYNHIFQAELNRRRQEVWCSSADQFRCLLRHAVRVFRRQVRSTDESTSFRAAFALLRLAGQSRFAPPDDPTDPHGVLDQHARKKRIEFNSIDPRLDLLDDDDRAIALDELLRKQQDDDPQGENTGI